MNPFHLQKGRGMSVHTKLRRRLVPVRKADSIFSKRHLQPQPSRFVTAGVDVQDDPWGVMLIEWQKDLSGSVVESRAAEILRDCTEVPGRFVDDPWPQLVREFLLHPPGASSASILEQSFRGPSE